MGMHAGSVMRLENLTSPRPERTGELSGHGQHWTGKQQLPEQDSRSHVNDKPDKGMINDFHLNYETGISPKYSFSHPSLQKATL